MQIYAVFKKFVIKQSLKIPPHLKRVATLHCDAYKCQKIACFVGFCADHNAIFTLSYHHQ